MQFVGKILVVLMFILSVIFMAFAGVVSNSQTKWREYANNQKKLLEESRRKLSDTEQDLDRVKTDAAAKIAQADTRRAQVEADNTGLLGNLLRLTKEKEDASLAQKTSAEQAQIAGDEAQARNEESTNLRQLLRELQLARDNDFALITKLEDQVRGLQLDFDAAKAKNRDLLGKNSLYQQALAAAGINADPTELAGRGAPPPRVEGIVEDIRPARRQGSSELLAISLGSDQGLKKGHEMTVYRTGLNKKGQQPRFLCKIVIVETTPDKAVGEVIESTRNGVIQKGDNVTTKL
jgi:hypothetical protein